jgi:DNA (cytosine-5)-methyltransferase 1
MKPRLLDLYCCQGGAAKGYEDAGFTISAGIDTEPQPLYPYPFMQYDAIRFLDEYECGYDLIHASPPCQRYSVTHQIQGRDHPDLIEPTRRALNGTGRPWVIENVEGAWCELENPVLLCGTMFGLRTYRHRLFETGGFVLPQPFHPEHTAPLAKMGRPRLEGEYAHYVGNFSGVDDARADMSVPWMTRDGIRECIPPAYSRWVGERYLTVT